jgi:hypothetical protein
MPERVLHAVRPPAVGVCGFGRCGSTMVMSMLVAGGMTPGNAVEPPYEGDPQALHGRDLSGTCVKLLDGGEMATVPLGTTPAWRFVWLDRDPVQQAASYLKFLAAMAPLTGIVPRARDARRLAWSYAADRPRLTKLLREIGPVLFLSFESVLSNSRKAARDLRKHVWPALDVEAAASVVHVREPECLPDLSVELALIERGGAGDA